MQDRQCFTRDMERYHLGISQKKPKCLVKNLHFKCYIAYLAYFLNILPFLPNHDINPTSDNDDHICFRLSFYNNSSEAHVDSTEADWDVITENQPALRDYSAVHPKDRLVSLTGKVNLQITNSDTAL